MGQQSSSPYSTQTISGYDANFASDDGSQTDANKVKLSTLVSNTLSPIKTLSEAINTQLISAFSSTINNGDDVLNQMTGTLAFGSSELTIASGVIAPVRSHHSVDTESNAATDNLDTLTVGSNYAGTRLILRAESASRTVVVRHGQGNIITAYSDNVSLDDTNKWIEFMLVSTNWIEVGRSHSTALVRSYLAGLTLSNGTDTAHDIDIAAGSAVDNDTGGLLVLGSSLTKQIDAAWAVGTDAGGLDTGAVANSTTYHVWLIRRSDTGVVDALFSTSASAPTMPTNYDQKRRIGSVITDGSANIRQFVQRGDIFRWDVPIGEDYQAANPGTSAVLATLTVPTGIQVEPLFNMRVADSSPPSGSDPAIIVTSPDQTDSAASGNSIQTTALPATTGRLYAYHSHDRLWTNTSGQIRYRLGVSDVDKVVVFNTLGWVDTRGRDD